MADQKITLQRLGGHRFIGQLPSGNPVMIDGDLPQPSMGPMDLILMALGLSAAYSVIDLMEENGHPLVSYRVEVVGDRADVNPKGYTHITVTHYGAGPGITRAVMQRSVELAHAQHCPVAASFTAKIVTNTVLDPWPNPSSSHVVHT